MKEKKEVSNRIKYFTVAAIYCGNLATGASLTSYGAVLTTLQHKYGVDDGTISKVFSILPLCCLIGALLGGTVVFDRVNRQLAVVVIMAVQAVGMFLTPYCPTLEMLFTSVAIIGVVAGAYDTAQFVWMVEMMQEDCAPFVQGQHFLFAIGTIVGTVLMAQSLTEDDSITAHEKASQLTGPYTILAGLLFLTAIFQAFLFVFSPYTKPPTKSNDGAAKEIKTSKKGQTVFGIELWSWNKISLVVLSCVFYGAYVGMEMITFQFLPKFGQTSELKLSEQTSAYVLTGMTIAFAVGRGIATILVLKISAKNILCMNILLTSVANTILLQFASFSVNYFWMASILFGLGFSSTYASFAAFMERHLEITNAMGSILLVCSYGPPIVYPMIVGGYIETNPTVLCQVIYFSISVLVIAVVALFYVTSTASPKYSKLKDAVKSSKRD